MWSLNWLDSRDVRYLLGKILESCDFKLHPRIICTSWTWLRGRTFCMPIWLGLSILDDTRIVVASTMHMVHSRKYGRTWFCINMDLFLSTTWHLRVGVGSRQKLVSESVCINSLES